MPVSDEVLGERAQELALFDETAGIDVAMVREMELPLIELAVLTGYDPSSLAYACRSGKLEAEKRPHPRSKRYGWFTSVQAVEQYRAEIGDTPQEWGRMGAEVRRRLQGDNAE